MVLLTNSSQDSWDVGLSANILRTMVPAIIFRTMVPDSDQIKKLYIQRNKPELKDRYYMFSHSSRTQDIWASKRVEQRLPEAGSEIKGNSRSGTKTQIKGAIPSVSQYQKVTYSKTPRAHLLQGNYECGSA